MKIMLCIWITWALVCEVNAQNQLDFNQANTIIVETELGPEEAMDDIIQKLKKYHYQFLDTNFTQGQFKTKYKKTDLFDFAIEGKIQTSASRVKIVLRGIAQVHSFTNKYELTAQNKRNRNNLKDQAWKELKKISNLYPLGSVYYAQREQ